MSTSVIICFYKRIDFLTLCLDALREAQGEINEVVVADDGSDQVVVDRVRSLMSRYKFPIVHAWHPRQGPRRAATRNNGIRHASGDHLIFQDADTIALPGTVRKHVDAARPGCVVVGHRKETTEDQARKILSEGISPSILESIYRDLPDDPIEKEHRRIVQYGWLRRFRLANPRNMTFGGHFSAFRTDIESVNGYDENYVGWGAEDLDFALRMAMAGFRATSLIREAMMLHMWHPHELGNQHWKQGPNVNYFFRKDIPVFCENGLVQKSA